MNFLMKALPNGVTSKVARQLLKTRKNSPHVMFATGVVGVVATTVVASRATLRLDEVTAEHNAKLKQANDLHKQGHPDYSDQDYSKDILTIQTRKVMSVGRLYAPAIGIGVISICLLTRSHVVLTQRNSGLVAAYALLDKGFKEYRERVVETYGPQADLEFRHDGKFQTESRMVEGEEVPVRIMRVGTQDPSVYARFFDQLNVNWKKTPEYNLIFLRCQQSYANDMLHARGHIFLNEVYDMLGIERSRAGAVVGWVVRGDGDNYVDFGVFDGNNAKARDFVNGREGSILLDFNVDGVVYDRI